MPRIFQQNANVHASHFAIETQRFSDRDLLADPWPFRHLKLLLRNRDTLGSQRGEPTVNSGVQNYRTDADDSEEKIRHIQGIVVTVIGFILGVIGMWQGMLRRRLVIGTVLIVVSFFLCFVGPWRFFGLL
jgi:hypothetical protein